MSKEETKSALDILNNMLQQMSDRKTAVREYINEHNNLFRRLFSHYYDSIDEADIALNRLIKLRMMLNEKLQNIKVEVQA